METQFYMGENATIYTGDMIPGDRPATEDEVAAHFAAQELAEMEAEQRRIDLESIPAMRAILAKLAEGEEPEVYDDDLIALKNFEARAVSLKADVAQKVAALARVREGEPGVIGKKQ